MIDITAPPALTPYPTPSPTSSKEKSPIPPPPSPYTGLVLASTLLNADGCTTFRSFFRTGERNDFGAAQLSFYMSLPRPVRYLYYLWVRYVRRDPVWAGLLRNFSPKTAAENWKLVAQREAYRAEWHSWWYEDAKLDLLICPPNATPAVPHGGMHDAVSSCGYTFLWNLLDYAAGVLPVTKVDPGKDALAPGFDPRQLNGAARGAYGLYDNVKMAGLPVGVQVVGRRWAEEEVLAGMEVVEDALERLGEGKYQALEVG